MKTYVINLERRPDRLEHMRGECATLGVDFERVSAVDGQQPAVAEAAGSCETWRNGAPVHPNEYAAFQSHRRCWRALLESDEAYAAVLEDDVSIAPCGHAFFADDWIPSHADIIKLETFGVRVHLSKSDVMRVGDRSLRRLRSTHLGCGGYIISRRAAWCLLEQSRSVRQPVDWFVFDPRSEVQGTLSSYQLVPAIVVQGKRQSHGKPAASWAATSIPKRFAGEVTQRVAPRSWFARFRERGNEELRSLRLGTKYIVVPYR